MVRIIGRGGPEDPLSIPLATRQGTWILNERKQERVPEALSASIEVLKETFPNARLRSCTAVYNCAGMVFASRRTCVYMEEIPKVLREDGYKKLADLPDVEIGDLVIYRETRGNSISHIGVVVQRRAHVASGEWEIIVMSKWGYDGEYLHPLEHVPTYYGEPEFWTERRPDQ